MSTEAAALKRISSSEYLQGTADVPVPLNSIAVAIPQEVVANLSKVTGTALISMPGKVAVSSLSGIGWVSFGTLHKLMQAARFIFTGPNTARAVHEAAWAVDMIGQQELMSKEVLRDATLETVNNVAAVVPGGFLVQGVTKGVRIADAGSKQTQRWGLLGLRIIATTLFDFMKFLIGGRWFGWTERKVERIKTSFYEKMIHPSPLGEQLLLRADKRHSTALKLLTPQKPRPPVSACTEEEFEQFINASPLEERIGLEKSILDKVICSKMWGLSFDEAAAFRNVLERWIEKEIAGTTQSEEDKKVMLKLYAIYKTLPDAKKSHEATSEELAPFLKLPVEQQRDILFLLAYLHDDPYTIPTYLSATDLTKNYLLRTKIAQFFEEANSMRQEIWLPSEFEKLIPQLQYRVIKLVSRKCSLSPSEQSLFWKKVPNRSSWQELSEINEATAQKVKENCPISETQPLETAVEGDQKKISSQLLEQLQNKRRIIHTTLYYFNRLSVEERESIYDISFGEVKKLPQEQLELFLWEAVEKFSPPTFAESLSQLIQQMQHPFATDEREEENEFIHKSKENHFQNILSSQSDLRRFVEIANRRIPFENKILLRDYVDAPLVIYFYSEEKLIDLIEMYKILAHDESISQKEKLDNLRILKVLKKALEWHRAEIAERNEANSPLDMKDGKDLPPRKVALPETPLDAINQKIGSHIVTSGSVQKTCDILGLVLEKTISLSSSVTAQIPRAFGYTLDTTLGSTAVYGTICSLAIALQICAQFRTLLNSLAQSLKITVAGKEYSWLENVERPAAALPMIPLKLGVSLQDTFFGGMESVKKRFDSWSENIAALQKSQKDLEQKGPAAPIKAAIAATERKISSEASKVQEAAAASSDPDSKMMAEISQQRLKEIFSSSPDRQKATLALRAAAIPKGLRPAPQQFTVEPDLFGLRSGTRIEPTSTHFTRPAQFESVLTEQGITASDPHAELPDLNGAVQANPALNTLTQSIFQRASQLVALNQDLQIAQAAQNTISKASTLEKLFVQLGGERLSATYTSSISPSLQNALELWKKEAECASDIVNGIAKSESLQTGASFGLYNTIEGAGQKVQDTSQAAVKWMSEHVGDFLAEQQSEAAKTAARQTFDTALGYVAGVGSRSLATYFMYGVFGFYSPVIILPFLLSRTIPNLLNASAEPISRNLGKTIYKGYHGIAWAGKTGGFYTHKGMTAIGKFVQAAINRRQGYIDEARTRAFCSLEKPLQQYVFELVKESTQVDESMKKELIDIGKGYFSADSSFDPSQSQAFAEALLLGFDLLQPQDFLKITPAYFYHLDKRIQRRIEQLVKYKFPSIPFQKHEEIIAKFNELSKDERKGINKVSKDEFFALPPDKQYEFCFQVLHSSAYQKWYWERSKKPPFKELWKYIDPKQPTVPDELLRVLFKLYQDLDDAELSNISPEKLSSAPLSRQMRLFEIFDNFHREKREIIADAADTDPTSVRSILEKEHPEDPDAQETRTRLIAALASAFRLLPEFKQNQLLEISPLQVAYMTQEEKRIYLEHIIQKNREAKELLLDADLKEEAHVKTFIDLFNKLDEEEKEAAHQACALHQQTFSYLKRALIEELKSIDVRLQKAAQEKGEAEEGIIRNTNFLNALKSAGDISDGNRRIQALSAELRKAGVLKLVKEKEIAALLSGRKEIEKLLQKEKITIPACPIQEDSSPQPNPLTEAICELMMNALTKTFVACSTIQDLDVKYDSSKKDIASMVDKLNSENSKDAQELHDLLLKHETTLSAAYEEQKHRLEGTNSTLPQALEIIVQSISELFSQITDPVKLEESYAEGTDLFKGFSKLLPDVHPCEVATARGKIDSLFDTRRNELLPPKGIPSHRSSWTTVKALSHFLAANHPKKNEAMSAAG